MLSMHYTTMIKADYRPQNTTVVIAAGRRMFWTAVFLVSTRYRPSSRRPTACWCPSIRQCAVVPMWPRRWRGVDGVVSQLHSLLAGLDLLMAVDGYPRIADVRAAGAQRNLIGYVHKARSGVV